MPSGDIDFEEENTGKPKVTTIHVKDETDSGLCFASSHSRMTLNGSINTYTDPQNLQTVRLNIGGTIFEVTLHTLKKIPDTRLCRLADSLYEDQSYREESKDFFFDRNPAAFADILEYYRCGELHLDQASCGAIFRKELEFWELDFTAVSMCCWSKFDAHRDDTAMYEQLDTLFEGPSDITAPTDSNSNLSWVKFYIYHTLENPHFSVGAKIFTCISFIVTAASIFSFVVETHYLFQQLRLDNNTLLPAPNQHVENSDCCCQFNLAEHLTNHTADNTLNYTHNETDLEHSLHDEHHIDSHIFLHYFDYVTFAYFVLELLLRFIVSYKKKLFCREALNIIEFICICAHFTDILEHYFTIDHNTHVKKAETVIFLLKSLRIMRIFRIFRLFRHLAGFKVLAYTMFVSFFELLLILSFLFTGVLIFASIIHYVEEETFTSIPYSIWWALVTMTTVGYGDVTPKTPMGYFIGALCVVSGALVVAFTVPVVVNNFTVYYNLSKSRKSKIDQMGRLKLAQNALKSWRKLTKYRKRASKRRAGVVAPNATPNSL